MRKLNKKKGIVALCIIIPITTACAFIPKLVREHKKRKYTTELF